MLHKYTRDGFHTLRPSSVSLSLSLEPDLSPSCTLSTFPSRTESESAPVFCFLRGGMSSKMKGARERCCFDDVEEVAVKVGLMVWPVGMRAYWCWWIAFLVMTSAGHSLPKSRPARATTCHFHTPQHLATYIAWPQSTDLFPSSTLQDNGN